MNTNQEMNYDCKKGELLQSSKNANIECGNLDAAIKAGNTETKIKACFFKAYDLLSQKKIPDLMKDQLKENVKKVLPNNTSQFIFELTDSKGRKVKYDSETDNITVNSNILTITKYLILLILFLF